MNDMITIFNQLTHNELADCYTFENIIKNHFIKFKLVYEYMKYLDLTKVEKITCKDNMDGFIIKIIYLDEYENMDEDFKGLEYDEFDIDIYSSSNYVTIAISNIDKSEDEIYENRFNRRKKVHSR